MSHRKRPRSKDNPVDPNWPLRQNLPRRCKDVQPFYAIDMNFEEEDDVHHGCAIVKKHELRCSKRSSVLAVMNTKEEEKMEQQVVALSILSWLVEMSVVKENEIIWYKNKTQDGIFIVGKGFLSLQGIFCCCCQNLFSVSNFSRHRGDMSAHKPYENLFVEGTCVSLLTCMIEAWNRHSVPARDGYHHVVRRPSVRDNHDDSCLVCADGGDLMCCDKCPSTYHPKCMGFKEVPQGDWQCPYCRCKYCDRGSSLAMLLTCIQCLKKYHWECSEANDRTPKYLLQPKTPFCGKICLMLYRMLEEKVGRSIALPIENFSWTLVRRMDLVEMTGQNSPDLHQRAKCNSMVALASKLMEDSFKVIVDRQTRTNMVQSVVYSCGSNFTRTNFSRFYTAVLEFHEQIISVASLRMPSPKVAEIPFIATAESWRNHGMCRLLLLGIESALRDIGVERILIPSSEEMVRNWQKKKFGFVPLDEDVKKEITKLNTLMFPKTTRLQKVIKMNNIPLNDLNLPPQDED